MKRTIPFTLVITALIIVAICFGFYTKKTENTVSLSGTSTSTPQQTVDTWQTYKNEKYQFEIQYPSSWQVTVDDNIPGIHISKKFDPSPMGVTHHSNFTHVSIYPEGIGTEGVQGMIATSTLHYTETPHQAIDYLLNDGGLWATYVSFEIRPHSWQPWGFVWASVNVQGERTECLQGNEKLSPGACEIGVEFENAHTIKEGTINQADRDTEEKILESFKFIK